MNHLSRRKFIGLATLSPVALSLPRAGAAEPPTAPVRMATIGVTGRQMLRVSVFNHSQGANDFMIEVLDINGKLLGSFQGGCLPHTGAFTDFDVAAGLKKAERVQVHVNVTSLSNQPLGATAEVFDSTTGATQYPDSPCQTPLPDPRMRLGSIGMIKDQVARVSVFYHNDQGVLPGDFRIDFLGLDGTVVASHKGQVMPGTGAAVDWGDGFANFPRLKHGQRFQLHVDVLSEHPDMVGAKIEIYDPGTGATQYPDSPCQMPLSTP